MISQRHPYQIHLCIAIVKYRTKLKIPRKGVCTSFLMGFRSGKVLRFWPLIILAEPRPIHLGDKMRIGLREGLIVLPKDNNTPVICVGPGTGVAPMRAVIEDRIQEGSSRESYSIS